jgi:hypothetical protein
LVPQQTLDCSMTTSKANQTRMPLWSHMPWGLKSMINL